MYADLLDGCYHKQMYFMNEMFGFHASFLLFLWCTFIVINEFSVYFYGLRYKCVGTQWVAQTTTTHLLSERNWMSLSEMNMLSQSDTTNVLTSALWQFVQMRAQFFLVPVVHF